MGKTTTLFWQMKNVCRGKKYFFTAVYLKQPDDEYGDANGSHDISVIIQEDLPASFHPDIKLFCQEVIVVVSRIVCELVLDTGSGWAGIATAEGDAIHQELPVNVAL